MKIHATVRIFAVFLGLAVPTLASAVTVDPTLRWLTIGADGAPKALTTGAFVLTTKSLRMQATKGFDPTENSFRLKYYWYYLSFNSSNGTQFDGVQASSVPSYKTEKGYVSDSNLSLGMTDTYYYFAKLDKSGAEVTYSDYLWSTNSKEKTAEQGVKIGASGNVGVAKVDLNIVDNKEVDHAVGGDPTVTDTVVFVPDALFTNPAADTTGLWDFAANEFAIGSDSDLARVEAAYGATPSGWSFTFDSPTLTNAEFTSVGPSEYDAKNHLLISWYAKPALDIVNYEIISRYQFSDGSVAYDATPVAGEQAIPAVPEPRAWSLLIAGVACVGATLRRRAAGDLRGPRSARPPAEPAASRA